MQRGSVSAEGKDLRSVFQAAWRRKWVILVPIATGLIAGFVIGHPKVLRPVYRSSATLLVEFPPQLTRGLQGIVPQNKMEEEMARLRSIMQSNDFLIKVIDATGLREDPSIRKWVEKGRKRYPGMEIEELQDLYLTQWLRRSMRNDRGRIGENLISIVYFDWYPDRAREIVQKITDGVIEANKREQLDRVRTLHDFSLEQIVLYKQRLTEAENRLDAYARGITGTQVRAAMLRPEDLGAVRRLLSATDDELAQLSVGRDRIRATLETRSPNTAAVLRSTLGVSWMSMLQEVRDLERQYADASAQTSAAGGGVETIALLIARKLEDASRIASEIVADPARRIPAEFQSDAQALLVAEARIAGVNARRERLARAIGEVEGILAGQPERETVMLRLKDEVETDRSLYNAFVEQLATSQIREAFEATMAANRLTVLEPPSRPLKPFKPNRIAIGVLGLLAGLLLGIFAFVIVERQDLTFRDAREAERLLGLRVLGTLPQMEPIRGEPKSGRVQWTQARMSAYLKDSPGFQELRRIMLELRGEEEQPIRSLLITSTRGGEGKTTSCILLGATAAAEEPRLPVLLVDLDFRRASLGRSMSVADDGPGVIQMLEHRRIDENAFRKTMLPNMRILPLGAAPSPRNDLLTFESLSWLLPELTRRFGLVIIDSPPNLPVPDPLIIGQLVDAVIVVIKAGSTPRHMVERGVELQKQFTGNVRGILMNNVDESMPYYYHYRHYGYPYYGSRGSERS